MTLTFIHNRLAVTALVFAAICTIWGFVNFLRNRPVGGSYWGTLVIMEVLVVGQSAVGLILLLSGGHLARTVVHLLYGATAVLSLPAAYVYTSGRDSRRENLVYALVCLWLFFIIERGITTGLETVAPA
jgi:FtsH-binding integral membrane protein